MSRSYPLIHICVHSTVTLLGQRAKSSIPKAVMAGQLLILLLLNEEVAGDLADEFGILFVVVP